MSIAFSNWQKMIWFAAGGTLVMPDGSNWKMIGDEIHMAAFRNEPFKMMSNGMLDFSMLAGATSMMFDDGNAAVILNGMVKAFTAVEALRNKKRF